MNTLAIVTLIWGSSSLGVIKVANTPMSNNTSANNGVNSELWKYLAMRPEVPIWLDEMRHRFRTDYAISFSFRIPRLCMTSFSYSGSVDPFRILCMKYRSNATLAR